MKLPGIGEVKPKYVAIGGGVVAVLVGYAYYKKRQSGSSSSSSTATPSAPGATGSGDPYPPDGTTGNPSDPYSTDPATGMTYGDEQSSGGYGGYGGYGSGVGAGYPIGDGTGTGTTSTAITTNAQWAQQVEQDLPGIGFSATAVATAVGRYLAKLPLSPEQANIIQVAVAEEGPPPVGTFPIIPQPNHGGHKPPKHEKFVLANGHQDLYQIASAHSLSEAKLIELNPGLKSYEGSKKPVRRGTKVRIS
jgi:hypothetical protein